MGTHKLELFFFPECPYCQLVLDCLDELNLDIDKHNIRQDPKALDRLVKDTNRRTVPCLYIDNKPMHESMDIVRWLKKNYSKA